MRSIRRTILGATAASAALLAATPATASVTIEGAVSSISLNSSDPGLVVYASAIGFGPFSLANVGDSHVANVMRIGTNEGTVNVLEDLFPKNISATFSFFNPGDASGSPITGQTSGFYQLFSSCGAFAGGCGQVEWGSPQLFSFGDGGQFSVELFDATFATPGSATVSGRFTLLANSVPEPATWAMLLVGFGAIGASLRSRNARSKVRVRFA